MTPRCSREMDALLSKMAAQLGPLEKWSAEALETLDCWMADLRLDINDQILARDNEGVERDIRQILHSWAQGPLAKSAGLDRAVANGDAP